MIIAVVHSVVLRQQVWPPNADSQPARAGLNRRTNLVGILPDRNALLRLVGAVLAEQHDEWAEGRRYLGLEVLAKARLTAVPDPAFGDHESGRGRRMDVVPPARAAMSRPSGAGGKAEHVDRPSGATAPNAPASMAPYRKEPWWRPRVLLQMG
jgi:hypothetical protein